MQMYASIVAYFRDGWRHSGDAVGLRGIAQFLRGNLAEAVKDISSALKMKQRKWLMYDQLYKLACTFLERSRARVPPVFGNWLPLTKSGCGDRYASAHTQCGKLLYVFGGLQHSPQRLNPRSDDALYANVFNISMMIDDATEDTAIPLNDFLVYDMEAATWQTIEVIVRP